MRLCLLLLLLNMLPAAEETPSPQRDAARAIAAVVAAYTVNNAIWTYQELIEQLRAPQGEDGRTRNPDHIMAIYCGSRASRFVTMLAAGDLDAVGIPVCVIGSEDLVPNPWTNRTIAGARLFSLYGGAPGSIVFIDRDGVPIPMANLPHLLHSNSKQIIESHFTYFSGGHHKRMAFADYVNAVGADQAIKAAQRRMDQGFLGQMLAPATPIFSGTLADGQPWNAWEKPGVVHLVTADVTGRAFRAQLANVLAGAPQVNAKIAIVVPSGSDLTALAAVISQPVTFIFAPQSEILRLGPSPRLVVTTGLPPAGTGHGCEIWGYLPFELLAMQLGMDIKATTVPDKDMPVGETDMGSMPTPR